jgi:hypothetical protein
MTLLGLALLAIGVGDLIAGGLGGEVKSARRGILATAAGLATAALGFCLTGGGDGWAAIALHVTVIAASLGWSIVRVSEGGHARPLVAIVALSAPLGLLTAT